MGSRERWEQIIEEESKKDFTDRLNSGRERLGLEPLPKVEMSKSAYSQALGILIDVGEGALNALGLGGLVNRIKRWVNGGENPEVTQLKQAYGNVTNIIAEAYGTKLPKYPSQQNLNEIREKVARIKSHSNELANKSFAARKTVKERNAKADKDLAIAEEKFDQAVHKYEDQMNARNQKIDIANRLAEAEVNYAIANPTTLSSTILGENTVS